MTEEITIKLRTEVEGTGDVEQYRKEMSEVEKQTEKTAKSAEKAGKRLSDSTSGLSELGKDLGQLSPTFNKINTSLTKLTKTWQRFNALRGRKTAGGSHTSGNINNTNDYTDATMMKAGRLSKGIKGVGIGVASAVAIGSLFNAITGSGSKLAAFDKLNTLGEPSVLDSINEKLPQILEGMAGLTTGLLVLKGAFDNFNVKWGSGTVPTPSAVTIPVTFAVNDKAIREAINNLPKVWTMTVSVSTTAVVSAFKTIETTVTAIQRIIASWFDGVADRAGRVFDECLAEALKIAGIISGWFTGIVTWANGIFDEATKEAVAIAGIIGKWFKGIPAIADMVFDTAMVEAGKIADIILTWFAGASARAGKIFDECVAEAQKVAGIVSAWFVGVATTANRIFDECLKEAEWIGFEIATWFSGIAAAANKVFDEAMKEAQAIWSIVHGWFSDAAATASRIFDEAMSEANKVKAIVSAWFVGVATVAGKVFDECMAEASKVKAIVFAWFVGASELAGKVFDECVSEANKVRLLISSWFAGASELAGKIFDEAVTEANKVRSIVSVWFVGVASAANTLFDKASQMAENVRKTISAWFNGLPASANALFSFCLSSATSVGTSIANWFNNSVLSAARQFWNAIASWVNSIGSEIASWGDMAHRGITLEEQRIKQEYEQKTNAAREQAQAQYEAALQTIENPVTGLSDSQSLVATGRSSSSAGSTASASSTSLLDAIGQAWNDDMQILADIGNAVNDAIGSLTGSAPINQYTAQSAENSLAVLAALVPASQMGVATGMLASGKTVEEVVTLLRAAGSIPAFADGTVFQPNKPTLGIFGDNRREVEVASPYSTIVQAVRDAMSGLMASLGGQASADTRPIELSVNLDGRTIARTIYDPLENEKRRRNGSVAL